MKNIVIIVLAAVSLSSCGIYNKYQRPADITADGLYGQEVSTDDTASIASLSWREVFADPRLQQLIDSALANNTDLLSARERIKEAEATLMSARLAYLLSFMLTPQGGVSSFDGAKGSWTYTGIASASWEVDIFGRLTNAKRRSKALYEQSLEYEQAVSTSLIANMANLYYTLLMLDEQYRISQETALSWQESVRTMRAMMEAGMTNEAGVAQAEANCRQVEASLLDLEQQIKEVENSICILLGTVPGPVERGRLEGQTFPEDLSVGVPHAAADAARHDHLPGSAHGPAVPAVGPTDAGGRPLRRDTGHRQPLPGTGRRQVLSAAGMGVCPTQGVPLSLPCKGGERYPSCGADCLLVRGKDCPPA